MKLEKVEAQGAQPEGLDTNQIEHAAFSPTPDEGQEFDWVRNKDCVVIENQPRVAVYMNQSRGICIRAEGLVGYDELAKRLVKAILARAKEGE